MPVVNSYDFPVELQESGYRLQASLANLFVKTCKGQIFAIQAPGSLR
jgi:hypothetical protein